MCQARIIMKQGDSEQVILENASTLEVSDKGITVSAIFEQPIVLAGAEVHSIDFLNGRVIVTRKGGKT